MAETAKMKLPEILKEAAESTNLSVSLEAYSLSDQICKDLTKHGELMWSIYRKLHGMVVEGSANDQDYEPILQLLEKSQPWYQSKAKAGKALLRSQQK